jgi:hypothetical protein
MIVLGFMLGSIPASADLKSGTIVLGKKNLLSDGTGWGSAHPSVIFNGGDPSGRAWNLQWIDWGTAVARARGLTSIFAPHGGYEAKPGVIELRASVIGRCSPTGPPAYTRLEARESASPGGPLGRWFVWGGWRTICQGP